MFTHRGFIKVKNKIRDLFKASGTIIVNELEELAFILNEPDLCTFFQYLRRMQNVEGSLTVFIKGKKLYIDYLKWNDIRSK